MDSSVNANQHNYFKKLNIHTINVNSIISRNRRHELALHLEKFKPDVVLISETCLSNFHKLNFKNYDFIRKDKSLNGRGTGILIKSIFSFKLINLPNISSFEYTAISVNCVNDRKLFIFSIYFSNNRNFNELANVFDIVRNGDYVVCGGDFNARHSNWSNYANNHNGIELSRWMSNNSNRFDLSLLHSLLPSRYDSNSYSYIDLFIVNNNLKILPNNSVRLDSYDYNSDHRVVVINVELPRLIKKDPIYVFDYSKADWKNLKTQLSALLNSNMPSATNNINNDEINNLIGKLGEYVDQTIVNNIPKVRINPNTFIKLNDFTLLLIKKRRTLRRTWFNSGRQNNTLKSLILRLNTIIQQRINLQYEEAYRKKFLSVRPGPNLFKEVKKICNLANRSKYSVLIDGCAGDVESAEALANYFQSIHNTSLAVTDTNNTDHIRECIENLTSRYGTQLFNFNQLSPSDRSGDTSNELYANFAKVGDIAGFIKGRKNNKSSGISGLSNYVMKNLPVAYHKFLTILINNAFNNGYFPDCWKSAIIAPIPKNNSNLHSVEAFRPISLLSSESKIFECFLKEYITNFCLDNNIGHELQFGFRKSRSTSHAITYFLEKMHRGFLKKEPFLAVSLDLRKAFDTVWIEGLIFKLKLMGFSDHVCKLLFSFLSNRSFKVKVNNVFSTIKNILAGVPQGSILGPILFNLYISDFPCDWENRTESIFFADDILLFRERKNVDRLIDGMNNYLINIADYLKHWKLTINESKCEAILFRLYESFIPKSQKKYKDNLNVKIEINNCIIQVKDSIKYLGVIFQNKRSVIPQINYMLKKANGAYALLKTFFKNQKFSCKLKEICYKQLIRPILQYAYPGWCSASSFQMNRIRKFERKVLYKCLPTSEAYRYLIDLDCYRLISKISLFEKFKKVKRFDVTIFDNFIKFFSGIEHSDIEKLKDICSLDKLDEIYTVNNSKYKYKAFAPSYAYFLFLNKETHKNNGSLTFYNRKFNSNSLDEYVYDLAEPD